MPRIPALLAPLLLALLACGVPIETPPATETPAATPTAAAVASPAPTETLVPGPSVTINAVGDVMLARDLVDLMVEQGAVYPFERVHDLLADADITIANLEGTFTDRGTPADKEYTFRTPPRHARGLTEAGIDVVSLGNNHTTDFGDEGLEDTLRALDAAEVLHTGAGPDEAAARAPVFVEANGLRVAFLSYNAIDEVVYATEENAGAARADGAVIAVDVAAARAEADLVVVSLHFGSEYADETTEQQRSLARTAVAAGASLVLGHHPHVLQGWEQLGSALIVYSLGNFVFDLDVGDLETLGPAPFQTLLLSVELGPQGVLRATAHPIQIDVAENRPRPTTEEEALLIETRLATLGISP